MLTLYVKQKSFQLFQYLDFLINEDNDEDSIY